MSWVIEVASQKFKTEISMEAIQAFKVISPNKKDLGEDYEYIHKSIYEYYISKSIIDTRVEKQEVDPNSSILQYGYLGDDPDILEMISEELMDLPVQEQYQRFFEIWYRYVL